MLFSEPRFLLFFTIVFAFFWSLGSNRHRKLFLLIASYVFYGLWDWRFLFLLAFITLQGWVLALLISNEERNGVRKFYAVLSASIALGILSVFKYLNFFAHSGVSLASLWGARLDWNDVNIILPIGISFYSFHTLGYVIDVYRKDIKVCANLPDFALFVAFFPQLVAGPILRARNLLPQLEVKGRLGAVPLRACIVLFLIGFLKKTGIADNLAFFIDPVFAHPSEYTSFAVAGSVFLYAAQIYCDFSGYSDMAISISGLLGYTLWPNFDRPYLSRNLISFWRTWHMSLSMWLRDYLYISMGGSHKGELRRYCNLLMTMVLGGLWHGASWNFVIWGALHGVALCVNHLYAGSRQGLIVSRLSGSHRRFYSFVGWLLTSWWVCLAWIFFRSPDFASSMTILKALSGLGFGERALGLPWIPVVLTLLSLQIAFRKYPPELLAPRLSPLVFGGALGAMLAISLALLPQVAKPFVYFQF